MTRRTRTILRVEPLGDRLAPATLTFTDVDGDDVKITTTGPGTLTLGANVIVNAGQLERLDLTGAAFQGANVSIVATRHAVNGGDGRVNVGKIDATGRDLGAVLVDGDLGQLQSGSGADPKKGVAALTAVSLGRFGISTGAAELSVVIDGRLGALSLSSDWELTSVRADSVGAVTVGGSMSGKLSGGAIGVVKIGGDLRGGTINSGIINASSMASLTIGGSMDGLFGGAVVSVPRLGPVKIGGAIIGGGKDLNPGGFVAGGGLLLGFTIASVSVGGSVVGSATVSGTGQINGNEKLGPVTIGGDVRGGGISTGFVGSRAGTTASITIGGSVIGGSGNHSGEISASKGLGPVRIGGSVIGGAARESGYIQGGAAIASVTIGGSLLGGGSATEINTGVIFTGGPLGPVKIGGDVIGKGFGSGVIEGADVASVRIDGSLIGGDHNSTGFILSRGNLGAVHIGGDIIGGNAFQASGGSTDSTGYIQSDRIKSVFVGGSIFSGIDDNVAGVTLQRSGMIGAFDEIGSITVRGSLVGNETADHSQVFIVARGQLGLGAAAKTDVAIGRITIGGSMKFAEIAAGYTPQFVPANADAQIGRVVIAGDMIASSIVAGIQNNDSFFGTPGDRKIDAAGAKDNADARGAVSKIASVVIKGSAYGTFATNDPNSYGIVAQQLGTVKIGDTAIGFTAGPSNDLFAARRILGSTRGTTLDGFDFHAFEV
jgi:hypothetical protein